MNIDRERLAAYVSEIKTSVEILQGYRGLGKEEFLASPMRVRDAKYCFIIAAQAAVDICYHLSARVLKKAPSDYANCFELLL